MVRFDLGPLLQGQTTIAKLKSADNMLIIGPRGLQYKTNLKEVMGWESSISFSSYMYFYLIILYPSTAIPILIN